MYAYEDNRLYRNDARNRYRHYVVKAQIADLWGRLTGHENDLVDFDNTIRTSGARQPITRGVRLVPVQQIVGSVGRSHDFTRDFLPRASVDQERWSRIDAALNALEVLPPVELYKVGGLYFVLDGNHRVSVARANGVDYIEAYVTELATAAQGTPAAMVSTRST